MFMVSLSPFRSGDLSHRGSQDQHPGADLEMGRIGGSKVDVEANLTVLQMETYHPAVRQEIRGLAHCKDRHTAYTLDDCGLAPGLVAAEKEDVAALDFRQFASQADVEYPPSDELAFDGVLEFLTARLVVEDAESNRRVSGVEDAGRPIYKLREVEKKRSFNRVLTGSGLGSGRLRHY
jgi:hypothetical protein